MTKGPPEDFLGSVLEEAVDLRERGAPLRKIVDRIWFGFSFHSPYPSDREGLLEFAFGLYDEFKDKPGADNVPSCMLLIGRIFNARRDYLPACRFFRVAKTTFKSEEGIVAMEFFREELRTPGAQEQIGLSKEQFEKRYASDTAESLVKEYRKR